MTERIVESSVDEVPEIPEILEKVLLFSLDRAKGKMEEGEDVVPFTSLAVKETLFMESHPGDDEQACFNLARHTVQNARGAEAYSFCYDGYVDLDTGMQDALIAEGGVPGADKGFAVGQLYTVDEDGTVSFESEPVYIGPAPNFMIALKPAGEYDDEEIDEKYLDDEEVENEDDGMSSDDAAEATDDVKTEED